MENKALLLSAADAAALVGVTLYLVNRISALEARVVELEKNDQAIAKHSVTVEKAHADAINKLVGLISNGSAPRPAGPPPPGPAKNPPPQMKPPPQVAKNHIVFSDEPSDHEEDEEEEEEAPPTPPPVKKKQPRKIGKNGIKMPAATQAPRARSGMDDVRQRAALLEAESKRSL